MVMRYLMSMLLVLTGFMVAASPVAAVSMSDGLLCTPQLQVADTPDIAQRHAAHAHHAMVVEEPQPADRHLPVCCDHACVLDAPVLPVAAALGVPGAKMILAWSSSDLVDLTDPTGLQRPPKA